MSHIFISYKHKDSYNDFADNLINRVKAAGFITWRDSDELRAGEVWRMEIDQAIKDAFAMIVIMTPEAKVSEYVTYEWAFALGVGVKLIPVILKPTELHPRLDDIQHLDFTNGKRPWHKLIDDVQKVANANRFYRRVSVPRDVPPHIKNAIDALDNPNPADREGAIAILVKERRHPIAYQGLIIALEHDLRDVRIKASLSLANFSNLPEQEIPNILKGLLEGLHANQYSYNAAQALEKFGEKAIPGLFEALDDKQSQVRTNAALALGLIKDTSAVPRLLKMINNDKEEYRVRITATEAVRKIGGVEAALGLLKALHYEYQELYRSKVSIEEIERDTLGDIDALYIESTNQTEISDLIRTTAEILGKFEGNIKTVLINNLHDTSCEVCSTAFKDI